MKEEVIALNFNHNMKHTTVKTHTSRAIGTLSNSFTAMKKLGPEIMNPFLQDVLQFGPLLK